MKKYMYNLALLMLFYTFSTAQVPGSAEKPIRYIGTPIVADQHYHDGQLRPAVGVHSYQAMRANRTNPPEDDGSGNHYNHSPMLAYWNNQFYLCYVGSKFKEHGVPTQTYLMSSENGRDWSNSRLIFPAVEYEKGKYTIATHRMSFYTAPDGRLLVSTFLGIPTGETDSPVTGNGVGRFIREIYKDNSLGPIHVLRAMPHAGYPMKRVAQFYPSYKSSSDAGFVEACEALLGNKLMTQQWWEEDRSTDGFYALDDSEVKMFDCKGMCYYHRKDGKVVGLWKRGFAAISEDEGNSWSTPVKIHTKPVGGAKEWCQRTSDGRYALVYNPMPGSYYRWPLGVITGDDGITFDNLLVVQTEVPLMRSTGQFKNPGTNYIRGILEGNGTPPGDCFWVTFSMSKEDLWVSRIPVPVGGKVEEAVNDSFENPQDFYKWNVYSPQWAPVSMDKIDGNGVLKFQDQEYNDYAKAVRVFPESKQTSIKFKINLVNNREGHFEIDALDRYGNRALTIKFVSGRDVIWVTRGTAIAQIGGYGKNKWHEFQIDIDAGKKSYSLSLDGNQKLSDAPFYMNEVESLERMEFRSGFYRREDSYPYIHFIEKEYVLPNAYQPVRLNTVLIDDVQIQ